MRRESFAFSSPVDGSRIYGCMVMPTGEPVGILQMNHGMAEHKERYLSMMEYFAARGYVCAMHDHRGHGESVLPGKPQGYFGAGGRALVEDAREVTGILRRRYLGLPLFFYGHSMGSLVARSYRQLFGAEADGYFFSGNPGGSASGGMGRAVIRGIRLFRPEEYVSHFMENIVSGGFSRAFPGEGSPSAWLSTDPAVARAYDADGKCGFPFTLNGYRGLMDLIDLANSAQTANCPDKPVRFLSGEKDPCMPGESQLLAALDRVRRSGCRDVSYRIYPAMRHEIHNEPGRETVFEDIFSCMESWRGAK